LGVSVHVGEARGLDIAQELVNLIAREASMGTRLDETLNK